MKVYSMKNFWITEYEIPERSDQKVIIHRDPLNQFKCFPNMNELRRFADNIGFDYSLWMEQPSDKLGVIRTYSMSHYIDDPYERNFWDISEIPPGAKKIFLMTWGKMATCYRVIDGDIIHIFRPNPNAIELYKGFREK